MDRDRAREPRWVPGRGYALGAVVALLAGFVVLGVLFVDRQWVYRSLETASWWTRAGSLAIWALVGGVPLLAGILGCAQRRYAVRARWVAVGSLLILIVFCFGLGFVFVPAFGLMLVAALAGREHDRRQQAAARR